MNASVFARDSCRPATAGLPRSPAVTRLRSHAPLSNLRFQISNFKFTLAFSLRPLAFAFTLSRFDAPTLTRLPPFPSPLRAIALIVAIASVALAPHGVAADAKVKGKAAPAVATAGKAGARDAMLLLHANCFQCHNENKRKGGLLLTTREAALKGGDNGPALVPGKPAESKVLQALAPDADPHMPPKKQLTDAQIATFREWISKGAPWDEAVLSEAQPDVHPVQLGVLPAEYHPVLALALSPDGKRLAFGRAGRIFIHDAVATNFPLVATLEGPRDAVQSVAWSPDGRWLAAGEFRRVLLWDARDLKPEGELAEEISGRVSVLAFRPDSAVLAVAEGIPTRSGVIHLWTMETRKPLATWEAHRDSIYDLKFSRDGALLASASGDKQVRLWEPASHKEVARLEGHTSQVLALAFNKDSTMIASGGADKGLKIWDVKTRDQLINITRHTAGVTSLWWTPDGTTLFSASEDGATRRFSEFKSHTGGQSTETARERSIATASEELYSLTATDDGQTLFAGAHDGAVYIWNRDGALRAKLEGAPASTNAPAVSASSKDGK
jgi:mono/diheme cytochrome c family protein